MDIERDTLVEIAASVGAVAVMIGVMMAIGAAYSANGGGLTAQGGKMLVGAIAFFVLLMAGVGYVLAIKQPGKDDDGGAANGA